MQLNNIPFTRTDWNMTESAEHPGVAGKAIWRTQYFDDIRVRRVEYTPGCLADYWYKKGHILLCLEGPPETKVADSRKFVLTPSGSYQVADHAESHRSSTTVGAKFFTVD